MPGPRFGYATELMWTQQSDDAMLLISMNFPNTYDGM